MSSFNLSGTFNVFKLLFNPSLCLPHATVSSFNQIPLPISKAFSHNKQNPNPDIRAVVLDKDNCFAVPHENVVYSDYKAHFASLSKVYDPSQYRLLIVSNTAGAQSADPSAAEAHKVELGTGVQVLVHTTKKPGCGTDVMEYFRMHPESGVTHPSQVCVVGDRLFTDMMMANMMGSWGLWVKDGVEHDRGAFVRFEKSLESYLQRHGYAAPHPASPFDS